MSGDMVNSFQSVADILEVASAGVGDGGSADALPFGAERFDDGGQDEALDVGARGVMGAEFVAFARVEGALEQGTIPNPARSAAPSWPADTLPVTRSDGDLDCTLERVGFVTLVRTNSAPWILGPHPVDGRRGKRRQGRSRCPGLTELDHCRGGATILIWNPHTPFPLPSCSRYFWYSLASARMLIQKRWTFQRVTPQIGS